jgi:hypothetical protein
MLNQQKREENVENFQKCAEMLATIFVVCTVFQLLTIEIRIQTAVKWGNIVTVA